MTILHNPANDLPRHESVFAFLSRDKDGNEGLLGFEIGGVMYCAVCGPRPSALAAFEKLAAETARALTDKQVVMVEYTTRRDVKMIDGRP